ncbi:hypothetical protein AB6N01_20545 [Alcaligenes nematophilus]|uniref:hypothetical protein n=1 Tax=Alcaligenes nematophilus TaxID=2994643 RepID=UPI0034E0BA22
MQPTFQDIKDLFDQKAGGGSLKDFTIIAELERQGFAAGAIRNSLEVFINQGLLICDQLGFIRIA